MRHILYCAVICLTLVGAKSALAQESESVVCEAPMTYENHNQVDQKPLKIRRVEGIAKTDQGIGVWNVCVGLFSDKDHKLVGSIRAEDNGHFVIPKVPNGQYRLVAKRLGFCTANVPLHVGPKPLHRKQTLVLHMQLPTFECGSYGTLAKSLVNGERRANHQGTCQ